MGLGLPHHLDKSIVSVRSGACVNSEDVAVNVVVDDEVVVVVTVLSNDEDDDEVEGLMVEYCELGSISV